MCSKVFSFFRVFLILLSYYTLLSTQSSFSQSRAPLITNIICEGKTAFGVYVPHHSYMNYLIEEYQHGIEFQFKTTSNGNSVYDSLFRFPNYGIAFLNTNLGNAQKLGRASIIFALIDIPFFTRPQFRLLYQGNYGIAYAHKSLEKSIYNTITSSPWNMYIGFDIISEFFINKQSAIRTSIELSHISNGKTKTPNIGINGISISAGYVYEIRPNNTFRTNTSYATFVKNHYLFYGLSGAYKTDDFLTNKKYIVSSSNIQYQFQFHPKYRAIGGFDMFYDESLQAPRMEVTGFREQLQTIETGVSIGAGIQYANMILYGLQGKYLRTFAKKTNYYQRVGIQYHFPKLYLSMGVKSHGFTADFMELGIGYKYIW